MKLRFKKKIIHEKIFLHSINDITMTVNLFNDDEESLI